jgi:hypothetical protein
MRRLSESENVEIWEWLVAGEWLRSISRRLGRPPSAVRTHVVSLRFRRPLPAVEWSPRRLSLIEREEISRGFQLSGNLSQGPPCLTTLNNLLSYPQSEPSVTVHDEPPRG